MGKINIKPILQYFISFLIAVAILWYVFRDMDISEMVASLQYLDYSWIMLSLVLSLLSHLARAYRWNILLGPLGYSLRLYNTFLAVLVGYLANLAVPRMGEVTKCAILKKTNGVPVRASLGTVVAERFIDFLTLLFLLALAFLIEFNRLNSFMFSFFNAKADSAGENLFSIYLIMGILLFVGLIIFIFARAFKEQIKRNPLFIKIKGFLRELVAGIISVRKIKNKTGFWISTIFIWFMYYLMAYVVFFSLPQTAGLSIWAGLSILVMGGLGMAAPVQGGIGTYHALVSGVLLLYGIAEQDGVLFATVLHTSQMLATVLFGGIALILSILIKKQKTAVAAS